MSSMTLLYTVGLYLNEVRFVVFWFNVDVPGK